MGSILLSMVEKQNYRCYYCNCTMCFDKNEPNQATVEHIIDKWSSPRHVKNHDPSNLVAACFKCNNTRGALRNRIARQYYKSLASSKNMKLAVSSTASKKLFSLFGAVPQHLFNE